MPATFWVGHYPGLYDYHDVHVGKRDPVRYMVVLQLLIVVLIIAKLLHNGFRQRRRCQYDIWLYRCILWCSGYLCINGRDGIDVRP